MGHALSGSCYEDLLLNTDNKNLGPESNNEVQVHHTTGIQDGMPIKHLVNRGVDNYFTFGLDYNPVNWIVLGNAIDIICTTTDLFNICKKWLYAYKMCIMIGFPIHVPVFKIPTPN